MSTKYSVQFNETVVTTDKQWLIHSDVLGGFTVVRIDMFWTLGVPMAYGANGGVFTALEAGQWGIEVVNTGAGAFSLESDFDDARIMGIHGYGTEKSYGAWPDSTTAGLIGDEITGELHWRGSKFFAAASDLYVAYSQANYTVSRVPKGWCSVTVWT